MATAYYSTIFQEPAADIWEIVRDFNNYPIWVDGCGDSLIEGGKSGEAVGAIRSILYQGRHIRQRLLALSDTDRSQTYEFCGVASTARQRLSGHSAHLGGRRWQPRLCRMVGELRLRARSPRRADGDLTELVRQVARIAAGGTCRDRARVRLKHGLAALNPWYGTDSATLALISGKFFGFRTGVRLLHSYGAFGIGLPLATGMHRRQRFRTRV
jgi:hypothetical protein